jgi:hypothetical protein
MHNKLIRQLIFKSSKGGIFYRREFPVRHRYISGAHFCIILLVPSREQMITMSEKRHIHQLIYRQLCRMTVRLISHISNTSKICISSQYLANQFPIFKTSPDSNCSYMTRLLRRQILSNLSILGCKASGGANP